MLTHSVCLFYLLLAGVSISSSNAHSDANSYGGGGPFGGKLKLIFHFHHSKERKIGFFPGIFGGSQSHADANSFNVNIGGGGVQFPFFG